MCPAGAAIVVWAAVTVFVFEAVWSPTAHPSAAAIATSRTPIAMRRPTRAPGLFTARRRYSEVKPGTNLVHPADEAEEALS
jgi:hypothetical protein